MSCSTAGVSEAHENGAFEFDRTGNSLSTCVTTSRVYRTTRSLVSVSLPMWLKLTLHGATLCARANSGETKRFQLSG